MKIRKLIILSMACLFLVSVTACGISSTAYETSSTACGASSDEETRAEHKNENNSNYEEDVEQYVTIKNFQDRYVSDGEWKYYYEKGLARERISDGYVQMLVLNSNSDIRVREKVQFDTTYNIVGDWIYFPARDTRDDIECICRIKKDGTGEIERIATAPTVEYITDMIVENGYIYYYYNDGVQSYGIHQLKIDGTEEKIVLSSNDVGLMYDIIDDWIYYYNISDSSVRRAKIDGSNDEVLVDSSEHSPFTSVYGKQWQVDNHIIIKDGWIYYSYRIDTGSRICGDFAIFREKIDGTAKEVVMNKVCCSLINMSINEDAIKFEYDDYSNYIEMGNSVKYIGNINVDGTNENVNIVERGEEEY